MAAEIEKLDGVAATCAGLVDFQTVEECGSELVGIQGWPPGNYMFRELKIIDGENLPDQDLESKNVIVGEKLASVKKDLMTVGQTITISDEKFHIVGVFKSSQDIENGMVVMQLGDAQKALGKNGMMTGCTVKVKNTSEEGIAAVRAQIEGQVAEACGLHGKNPRQSARRLREARTTRSSTRWRFALMTSSVALFIGVIGVLNTMFMSVFERTREIGILRAIGWRPSRVMQMILMESVLLSIGGGVVGTVGGLGLIKLLSRLPTVNGVVQAAISVRDRGHGLCHCHYRGAGRRRLSRLSRFTLAADGGFAP